MAMHGAVSYEAPPGAQTMDPYMHAGRERRFVSGNDLPATVRDLIGDGTARHITIIGDDATTRLEIPLTLSVDWEMMAPTLSAVEAIAPMAASFLLMIERRDGTGPA